MPTPNNRRVGATDRKAINHSNCVDNIIDLIGFTDPTGCYLYQNSSFLIPHSSFENPLKGFS